MRGQRHAPDAPYPRERPGTHCTGGLSGSQVRSGQVRKISSPPRFDPRTVQPVGSRYTDYAIGAYVKCLNISMFLFKHIRILSELTLK